MVNLVNLTPHPIVVMNDSGEVVLRVPPSGKVARVAVKRVRVGDVNGIPLYRVKYGKVENLPPPRDGTLYIVSLLVLQACRDRKDLIAPDTSPASAVRDASGKIVGVKAFTTL